jgi:hypothetical protein
VRPQSGRLELHHQASRSRKCAWVIAGRSNAPIIGIIVTPTIIGNLPHQRVIAGVGVTFDVLDKVLPRLGNDLEALALGERQLLRKRENPGDECLTRFAVDRPDKSKITRFAEPPPVSSCAFVVSYGIGASNPLN